ncbi:MAG: 3-oxoacyl-[acyl-carrier-protein] reductase [Lachnospiraceae bacterium]|nr:3-oxoacyl-[acyl-carrier-protein] reductase [Lachnospiraceae bacterium]
MSDKKIALVTGAGRGIGREIAKTLARDGFFVIVNYAHSSAAADEAVNEIKAEGGDAVSMGFDVADFAAVEKVAADIIKEYGHLDVLVNNAGITRDTLLMAMKEEDFDAVINTNLKGTFNTMRHFSKYMIKNKGGRIINISSISGVAGNAGQANYSASKAGVIGLTKAAAKELGSRNITVNAVAPGYVDTEMTQVLSEKVRESILATVPMKRGGTVADIANAVAFLASDKASYITGQVIQVNGGMG